MQKLTGKKSYHSQLLRGMMLKYILTLVIYVITLVAVMLIGWQICASRIWFWEDPLYQLLLWVKDYILLVIGVCILIGWTLITYYYFRKPLRYLDEMIAASALLVQPTDTPIELSRPMREVQDELNAIRQQALRSTQAAKEAEQRKNDLVVYLAHDLKTPLTSVIGYLTLLRDEPQISPELRAHYVNIALDKAERLEDLVNEFFDITRFNLSHLELERRSTNLTRMLEQVASEFEPIFREKNLVCHLELPKEMNYNCDSDKLARVFDNLLRNAFHYSFPNTTVEILGSQGEEGITLVFANQGNTIPAAKLERIFDQFFRLDSSRASRTGGAGLGLAIAKEIVELHGGTINAASENNRIVFTVKFSSPCAPQENHKNFAGKS